MAEPMTVQDLQAALEVPRIEENFEVGTVLLYATGGRNAGDPVGIFSVKKTRDKEWTLQVTGDARSKSWTSMHSFIEALKTTYASDNGAAVIEIISPSDLEGLEIDKRDPLEEALKIDNAF